MGKGRRLTNVLKLLRDAACSIFSYPRFNEL